ncbi:MAG: hypothetical protein QG571_1867, partial [Pseudomonadota bacterium]|nr:hypothetical protein [Pseudomonadota bacterium]
MPTSFITNAFTRIHGQALEAL